MAWFRRLANLFRVDRLNRDVAREMAFHLEEHVDELVSSGVPEAEARRQARRIFGNPASLRERVHEADVLSWLESFLMDLRYAARVLRTHPAFTSVVVLSLALGIGANTAIFSLVNAVLLRPVPVRQPEELVRLTMGEGRDSFTHPLFEAIRDSRTLSEPLAFADWRFDLNAGGMVRHAEGTFVSGGYFQALGVRAASGRMLTAADDARGCPGAVVLSHAYWQREYGAAPDVIGRSIDLNGHPLEIVGVAQAGFAGLRVGRASEVFVPLCTLDVLGERPDMLDARSLWFLDVLGRLRPGQTLGQLQAGLSAAAPALFEATTPERWTGEQRRQYQSRSLEALPAARGVSSVRGQYREALIALLGVVGVVLLIACANVAQLFLARAAARHHEIATRLALGCGRGRLVRQLLTESLLLAFLGAALGAWLARKAAGLLVTLLSQGGRLVSLDLTLDGGVLAFTVALAVVTGLLFGIAPALSAARVDPRTASSAGARGLVGGRRQRLPRGIVACQVALSLVLVAAAGLLLTSFRRLLSVNPGFQATGVLLVDADWSGADLPDERQSAVPRELLDRVRQIPGVLHASASLLTPIGGSLWNEDVFVEGSQEPEGGQLLVWFNGISDGYLETLQTRLIRGRDLTPRDDGASPPVVLVNQTLARRFFGDADPLGKRIRMRGLAEPGPAMEIVGVVEDAKYRRLDEETPPTGYVPLAQTDLWAPVVRLALRASGAPSGLVPAVVDAVRDVHPGISLEMRTMSDQVAGSLARPRLLALLSGFFGALALALAVVGLYGTVAYDVARRRAEIGVRIALGAERSGILRMVAAEAGRTIALGVALGGLLTLGATRWLAALLYGVTALDPSVLGLSALVLAAAAMVAGLLPAWRATGIDPMTALREE